MANTTNQNSVPTFTRGTLAELQRAVSESYIKGPSFHFLTDEKYKSLAFVDIDNTIYVINSDKIEKLEEQLGNLSKIKDESGQQVDVADYVVSTNAAVKDIQTNGAAVMVTSVEN